MSFVEYLPSKRKSNTGSRSTYDKATLKVKGRTTTLEFSQKWCEEKKMDFTKGVSIFFDPSSSTIKLVANPESSWKATGSTRQRISIGRMLRQHGLKADASVFNLEIAMSPKDRSVLVCVEDHLSKNGSKEVKSSKSKRKEISA
jgi:hypothetical protein